MFLPIFEHFLTMWHYITFKDHPITPFASSEINHFSKETSFGFLLISKWHLETKSWELGFLFIIGSQVLCSLSRDSQKTQECVLTWAYPHLHIYFCFYSSVFVYAYVQQVYIDTLIQSISTRFILDFSLSLLVTPFSNSKRFFSHYPKHTYLFVQSQYTYRSFSIAKNKFPTQSKIFVYNSFCVQPYWRKSMYDFPKLINLFFFIPPHPLVWLCYSFVRLLGLGFLPHHG